MAQVIEKAREVLGENKKIRDLQRDTLDSKNMNEMTTDHGSAILDTDNWFVLAPTSLTNTILTHYRLRATNGHGPGPALLEDQIGREKIMRFDHERIPERVVHARGVAAHGYFKLTRPIPEFSFAPVLNDTSRKTPIFLRFSTVQGSRGSADTVRDVRGFAVKFYTDEGNWDIVGNNIPVFFIQDAIKVCFVPKFTIKLVLIPPSQFPDIIHSVKPEPHNEIPTGGSAHVNFYDFISLQPETCQYNPSFNCRRSLILGLD
jgi:catalase